MKTSKNTKNKPQPKTGYATCSTAHKVWGVIALVGLFACGFMIGISVNSGIKKQASHDADMGGFVETPSPSVVVTHVNPEPELMPTCMRIEELLKARLAPEDTLIVDYHLYNADTYSVLADAGCPENSEFYKSMALREIEIATALQPVEDMGTNETEIIIDTYKKLDMQQQAREFLDKVQKLTDPAIEFILKMEKIINE